MRTRHAEYILRSPDEQYRELFEERYRLIKLTTYLISFGTDPANAPDADSLKEFKEIAGGLALDGLQCTDAHIKSAVCAEPSRRKCDTEHLRP